MSLTISVTKTDITKAIGDLLTDILASDVKIVMGQTNRVPSPKAADYITMTEAARARLSTNKTTWDYSDSDPTTVTCEVSMMAEVRLDIHGPHASDNANIILQIMHDAYAWDFMVDNDLKPRILYADDPKQVPFITAEGQYEDRWIMNVATQVNTVLMIPAQFAASMSVGIFQGDSLFMAFIGDNGEIEIFTGDPDAAMTFTGGFVPVL